MAWISALSAIRPDERRSTLFASGTLFGLMAAHSVLETARDALFLTRLPAERLPFVYLAIAAVAILTSWLGKAFGHQPPPPVALTRTLVAGAVLASGFWFGSRWEWAGLFYFLYVGSALVITLLVIQFWATVQDLFTITQAKRIYR